jgi:hypothetical protein
MTDAELDAKFASAAAGVLRTADAAALLQAVRGIERIGDAASLARAARSA